MALGKKVGKKILLATFNKVLQKLMSLENNLLVCKWGLKYTELEILRLEDKNAINFYFQTVKDKIEKFFFIN